MRLNIFLFFIFSIFIFNQSLEAGGGKGDSAEKGEETRKKVKRERSQKIGDDYEDPEFLKRVMEIEEQYLAQKADEEFWTPEVLSHLTKVEQRHLSETPPPSEPGTPSKNTPESPVKKEKKAFVALNANRLTSEQEHLSFLRKAIDTAVWDVLITCNNVSYPKMKNTGLFQSIRNAKERGVAVSIYFKDLCEFEGHDEELNLLASCCTQFEAISNHAKCIAVDRNLAAVGSYDWLSNTWGKNSSFIITGGCALSLCNDIRQGLTFYGDIKYGNTKGINTFLKDSDAHSTSKYQYEEGQYYYTLRSPEAHDLMFAEVIDKARKNVVIHSPFIRLEKLRTTLTLNLLDTLSRKGVRLRLITLPTPCNRPVSESDEIFDYLNYLRKLFPNFFNYEVQRDLHAKTLISDDDFCCEGSLNWLSAVNDDSQEANQCEISVALRGVLATQLLQGHNPPLQIPAEEIPDYFEKDLLIKAGKRFGSLGY
jgi:hypothetical protein